MANNALRLGFVALGFVLSAGTALAHPSPSATKPIVYAKSPIVVATPVASGHVQAHSHGWARIHVHAQGPARPIIRLLRPSLPVPTTVFARVAHRVKRSQST